MWLAFNVKTERKKRIENALFFRKSAISRRDLLFHAISSSKSVVRWSHMLARMRWHDTIKHSLHTHKKFLSKSFRIEKRLNNRTRLFQENKLAVIHKNAKINPGQSITRKDDVVNKQLWCTWAKCQLSLWLNCTQAVECTCAFLSWNASAWFGDNLSDETWLRLCKSLGSTKLVTC